MFMVREELTNVRNLLRIWYKAWSRTSIWSLIAVAVFFLIPLSTAVFGIFQDSSTARFYSMIEFSVSFMFGFAFVFIILLFMYRSNYAKWSVFPQTNNSRFIAAQLVNYIIIVVVALLIIVSYLLNYGVISVVAHFRDGVYIAPDFDVVFIVAGFFVFLAYCSLIFAVIDLVGTILRKWTYYAVVAFAALFALTISNLMAVVRFVQNVLSFLTGESSLALFFLKAAGLWAVITCASFFINHFTVYHRSSRWTVRKPPVVVVCAAIAVVMLIVVAGLIIFSTAPFDSNLSYTEISSEPVDDFFDGAEEIRIDVSHLPRGSNLSIEGEGIYVAATGFGMSLSTGNTGDHPAFVSGTDALENLQGDTIAVRFLAPWYNVNGIDLFAYANPRVTAYLDGSTLFIHYSEDRVDIVIMPIWSFVRQFDLFSHRNVLTEVPFGYNIYSNTSANIHIEIE